MRAVSIAFIAILCAALTAPAWADNDKDKGHGQGHGGPKVEKNGNDQGHGNGAIATPERQIVIIDRDRDTVRTYYRREFAAGNCPPGLAKKNNGCLPPGQANRAWAVGQSLPPEIIYQPMPRELWSQLTPPPPGYEYARVDDNVVLISTATRVIAGLLGNIGSFGD
ncbi:MAG: RcnB family protein [Reyranella sp.]